MELADLGVKVHIKPAEAIHIAHVTEKNNVSHVAVKKISGVAKCERSHKCHKVTP